MDNAKSLYLFIIIIFNLFNIPCFGLDTIKIGSSTDATVQEGKDFEGFAISDGINLYFKKINSMGGINGQKIEFILLDDNDEPRLAALNMHRLIEKDKVLCITGNNGTPGIVVSVPIVTQSHVLLYGATSFTNLLRSIPPDRYVINFRAGLTDLVNEYVQGLLSIGIKPQEMGFVFTQEAEGAGEYKAFIDALKKTGFENEAALSFGFYDRWARNVQSAFASILRNARISNDTIRYLYLATTGTTINAFRLAHQLFPQAIIYCNYDTLSGINDVVDEMGANNIKIITIAPIPMLNSDLPAIREFHEDLKKFTLKENNPNSIYLLYALEGYLSTKLLVIALRQAAAANQLTREGLIDTFESLRDIDIGIGVKISISKENRQALHRAWPAIFKNNQFVPLEWNEIKENGSSIGSSRSEP